MRTFLARTAAVAATILLSVIPMRAQLEIDKNRSELSPDQRFGIGVNNAGLHIQYAMGPAFHLGLNLNLDLNSKDSLKPSIYAFGPYAKFIFSGGILKPYAYGAIGVLEPGSGAFGIRGRQGQPDSVYAKLPNAQISVRLAAGIEHFFNQDLGLYGHVNVVSAILSPPPVTTRFGFLGGVFGMEFFF